MSKKELSRLEVIQAVCEKQLKQSQAASTLSVSVRQLQRLIKSYRTQGAAGLISNRRGRKSNHCYPAHVKEYALFLIQRHYTDFGPTLAAEKLAEQHDLHYSVETLRQWMLEASLWVPSVNDN